jgi:hypothetical protein
MNISDILKGREIGGKLMLDQKCQEEYLRRIHKVQDYIENHMGQSLSIEELADFSSLREPDSNGEFIIFAGTSG